MLLFYDNILFVSLAARPRIVCAARWWLVTGLDSECNHIFRFRNHVISLEKSIVNLDSGPLLDCGIYFLHRLG